MHISLAASPEAYQDTMNRHYYFINPHTNHSYLTSLAISRIGLVEILCPPLTLQIILKKWKIQNLSVRHSCLGIVLAQPLACTAYIFFAFKLIPEAAYIFFFQLAARIILLPKGKHQIIYCYQDYLLPLMRFKRKIKQDFISEFIIQIPQDQPNYQSSLNAAKLAKRVVAPTRMIIDDLQDLKIEVHLSPYGGDKYSYRTARIGDNTLQCHHNITTPSHSELTIAARSNSHRKGLDILIGCLYRIIENDRFNDLPKVNIVICGSVAKGPFLESLLSLKHILAERLNNFTLTWGQLSQDSYLALLCNASMFLMPSRLEGSSYAALEALWMGVPAILSPQCGIEAFKPGEHGLLSGTSADSLSEALTYAFEHPPLIHRWQANLARDRSRFTWETYLREVANTVASI